MHTLLPPTRPIFFLSQYVPVDRSELFLQERGAFGPCFFERRDCCVIECSPLRHVHTRNIKRMPLNISLLEKACTKNVSCAEYNKVYQCRGLRFNHFNARSGTGCFDSILKECTDLSYTPAKQSTHMNEYVMIYIYIRIYGPGSQPPPPHPRSWFRG